MELNSVNHINSIINYYKENPGCDPNVYEFIQVCDEVSKDLNATSSKCGIYSEGGPSSDNIRKKYPEAVLVYDTFLMFHDVFFDKFVNCGVDTLMSHPLYELCAENAYNALHYNVMTNEEAEFNKMLGGVSFYILQQQRDVNNGLRESFKYDNEYEKNRILELDYKVFKSTMTKSMNYYMETYGLRNHIVRFIEDNYNTEYKINNDVKRK